jgi:hypothetical protein
MSSGQYTLCGPGGWTSLWDGPSFGFIYLWHRDGDGFVDVDWRRFGADPPFYWEGTVFGLSGQTVLVHGGPTAYVRIEVRPRGRSAFLRVA